MRFLIGLGACLAAALAAGQQPASDSEMQLEAAIHREVVMGDLNGAIAQYRAILAQPGSARTVAARSLYHLGQSLEKSGQRKEARAAYSRLVKEYGDQSGLAGQVRARLAGWEQSVPEPRNLNFAEGVTGKVPPGWTVPALPKDADHAAELRRGGCRSRVGCAVVLAPPNSPSPIANLMQSFSAASYRGKRVRLSAWVRLEASDLETVQRENPVDQILSALYGGDRAQMWLSVDRPHQQKGFFDNMDDRPVRSSEWTRCEISSWIDDDATYINFGVMSIGKRRVWVDDVSLEVIADTAR